MSNKPVDSDADKAAYQRLLARGFTKMWLAEVCGISKQAVTRWEAVPMKYVTRVAKAARKTRRSLRPSDFR